MAQLPLRPAADTDALHDTKEVLPMIHSENEGAMFFRMSGPDCQAEVAFTTCNPRR